MLTWPEMLSEEYMTPGNDFAGIVEAVAEANTSGLKPDDEVFGMTDASTGGAWAQYALVNAERGEVAKKPRHLGFEEAASVPLSALTAWQALFHKGGISPPSSSSVTSGKGIKVLITRASGNVGIFVVQIAALAGCHVIAASTSNVRNSEFLKSLGAAEVVEYDQLWSRTAVYDVAIDTVSGDVLSKLRHLAKANGTLVSVDSSSYDFANERHSSSRQDVKAVWFVVWPSTEDLSQIAELLEQGLIKTFMSATFPIEKVVEAYEAASGRYTARGKMVLTI